MQNLRSLRLGHLMSAIVMGLGSVGAMVSAPFERGSPRVSNSRNLTRLLALKTPGRKLHRPARAENEIARNQRESLGRRRVTGRSARNKQARLEARGITYANHY